MHNGKVFRIEEIRKKRGDEFEEKIFQKLKKKYPKNIKIKKDEYPLCQFNLN